MIGRATVIAAFALIAGLGLAACGASTTPTQSVVASDEAIESQQSSQPSVDPTISFTMEGAFDLAVHGDEAKGLHDGAACDAQGPDSRPVGDTTEVNVSDANGKVLATGFLDSAGRFVAASSLCVYSFTVDDVPDGLPSYTVTVGAYPSEQLSSTLAHDHVFLLAGV